jgi:hypothetical protein
MLGARSSSGVDSSRREGTDAAASNLVLMHTVRCDQHATLASVAHTEMAEAGCNSGVKSHHAGSSVAVVFVVAGAGAHPRSGSIDQH